MLTFRIVTASRGQSWSHINSLILLVGAIGQCVDDMFVITSPGTFGSPVICGTNSGYHSKFYFC